MASFESVVDEYDAARPSYPDELYDALGPLTGLRVLDVGAGTGVATRQLIARGADVVAVDPGRQVLVRAVERSGRLAAVVADGATLPVRTKSVDLLCFAQAWHWLDPSRRVAEAHRVLHARGRWAGWWSHARADDERWFDEYWSTIEQACPGTHRDQRDIDWGATIAERGMFAVSERIVLPWRRSLPVDVWLTDQSSHSYVIALAARERETLTARLRTILDDHFPGGVMEVPYETWLWIAQPIDS